MDAIPMSRNPGIPRPPARAVVAAIVTGALACGSPVTDPEGVSARRGGDLVATGSEVLARDSVPGDVLAAGGDVRFNGHAGGDVLAAGGNVVISGLVRGSVRAAAGNLEIHSDVGRNVTLAGGNVVLERGGAVAGNAYLAGGAIRVAGTVHQLVRAAGRNVVLDGTIEGDVHVESDDLRVGPAAVIRGDLRYRLDRDGTAEIDPAAVIEGELIELEPRRPHWLIAGLRWLRIAAFLFAGVVVVALMPRAAATAAATLRRRPAASFGFGLLWFLILPVALLTVAATLIGVPIALVGAAIHLSLAYLAPVVVALWIGALVLRQGGSDRGALVLAFLLGGVILALIGLIPYAGWAVRLLATVFGLGALAVMAWDGSYRTDSAV